MPDASGRFRGISIPGVPWHRETPCDCDLGCSICMTERYPGIVESLNVDGQTFGPARQQPGSTPTDTTRE